MSKRRLGDMLVEEGLISAEVLEDALVSQKASGRRLGEELVAVGALGETELTHVLSNQLSVPWVSLYHVEFSRDLLNRVPAELAQAHSVIPVYVRKVRNQGDVLFVATSDPTHQPALAAVSEESGLPVKPMIAAGFEIENAIRVYYLGLHPNPAPGPQPSLIPEPEQAPEETSSVVSKRPLPRMVTLTLLDGTTVRVPASGNQKQTESPQAHHTDLTASDLIAALLARSQGADVSDVLPDDSWEKLFATLLTLLIRKGLIADWEFVDEYNLRAR